MRGFSLSFQTLRLSLGLLVLAAVVLKVIDPSAYPASSDTSRRLIFAGMIEAELALAAWLFWGQWPRSLWAAATIAFGCFATFSLILALRGSESCGCFGVLRVSPWATFVLDLLVLTALGCTRPKSGTFPSRRTSQVVLSLYLVLAFTTGVLISNLTVTSLDSTGKLIGDASFVVLEPERWVGSKLPLFPYIQADAELHRGHWLVVIYHHACPTCIERLPHYEAMQAEYTKRMVGPQIALLELPPYAESSNAPGAEVEVRLRGRITASRDWFVETPAEIELRDGVVVSARQAVHQ